MGARLGGLGRRLLQKAVSPPPTPPAALPAPGRRRVAARAASRGRGADAAPPSPALRAKAARILGELDALYPDPLANLPLDHGSTFQFLVAVVLSAQSTDKKVNEITPALFAAAPDAKAMADLDVDVIREKIREIGLAPSKAKYLSGLSKALVERHAGEVPASFGELEALSGVGHKTASVVMSQAFGVPAFPVDTHIHRLAARWGLADGSGVGQTEKALKQLFPEDAWNRLHLAIIFYGREHGQAHQKPPAETGEPWPGPICAWAGLDAPPATTPAKKKRAAGGRGGGGAGGAKRAKKRKEGGGGAALGT